MERLFDLYDGGRSQRPVDPSARPDEPPAPAQARHAPASVADSPRQVEAATVDEPPTVVSPRPPLARDPERAVRDPRDGRTLAERLRPRTIDELVGQEHVLGTDSELRRTIESGAVVSLVVWGPAGCGKASLAHVIASHAGAHVVSVDAESAAAQLPAAVDEARRRRQATGQVTVVHVDGVHALGPELQDQLVGAVDEGVVRLVGATTENPFFELRSALTARCKLIQFSKLDPEHISTVLRRAVDDPERGLGVRVDLTFAGQRQVVSIANGNARVALEVLERAAANGARDPDGTIVLDADAVRLAVRSPRDRNDEEHYDRISAFVKSLRGSDPDAAVYWLLRLLESGEDPRFLTRRMLIFASEDIGLADPGALVLATSAAAAVDRVGLPEARHVLVHAAITLAVAPKSDSVARALTAGTTAVDESRDVPVPAHLRDSYAGDRRPAIAPDGYLEPHSGSATVVGESLPEGLQGRRIYEPTPAGDEEPIAQRVAAWREQADAANARRRAARATRQGGFIEGLDRAAWTYRPVGDGLPESERGQRPRDDEHENGSDA